MLSPELGELPEDAAEIEASVRQNGGGSTVTESSAPEASTRTITSL